MGKGWPPEGLKGVTTGNKVMIKKRVRIQFKLDLLVSKGKKCKHNKIGTT